MNLETLTLEAFKILLFIIPGIISLRIKAALAISAPKNTFNMTIDGLILTLVDHALYGGFRWTFSNLPSYGLLRQLESAVKGILDSPSLPGDLGRHFAGAGGFAIVLIAVGVGFVAGVIRYHGWEFRVLRVFRMTNRTGENLVWAEVMTKEPRASYVVVACKDGSRFMGVVDTFSEEAGNYELFLSRASQVQEDGTTLPIKGTGVLLTRENPIIRVEFWNPGTGGNIQAQGGSGDA